MKLVFVVLLALHSLVVIGRHPFSSVEGERNQKLRFVVIGGQFVLFVLATVYAYRSGVFSRALLSPIAIASGLVAGHLIFGFSLLAIYRSLKDASTYFFDFGSVWEFIVEHPYVLSRFLLVAVSEEIVWRAAAQPLVVELLSRGSMLTPVVAAGLGVGVVALAFAAVHDHFFKNTFIVSVEFLGFALVLGVLYYFTGSLVLVVIVHALRDIEIGYLEYLVKVQELGDEDAAARSIESTYRGKFGEEHE